MATKVFHNVRANGALSVLAVAGCVAGLSACTTNDATYRPAPHYTQTTQPPPPNYTQPAPAPQYQPVPAPKQPGGGSCGKKCG